MLSLLVTAAVGVHCTGAGVMFAYLWGSEKIISGMGSAFGYPGGKTSTLQKVGIAAVWEVPAAAFLFEKFTK